MPRVGNSGVRIIAGETLISSTYSVCVYSLVSSSGVAISRPHHCRCPDHDGHDATRRQIKSRVTGPSPDVRHRERCFEGFSFVASFVMA